jgi:hypothetical protein
MRKGDGVASWVPGGRFESIVSAMSIYRQPSGSRSRQLGYQPKIAYDCESMENGSRVEHERATIKSFISRDKQERFLTFVSKPKSRKKLTQELAHFRWFDPRFATAIRWKVDPNLGLWQRHVQGIENVLVC